MEVQLFVSVCIGILNLFTLFLFDVLTLKVETYLSLYHFVCTSLQMISKSVIFFFKGINSQSFKPFLLVVLTISCPLATNDDNTAELQ